MRSTIWMSQRPMLGRLNGLRRRSIRTGSTTPHNRGLHIIGGMRCTAYGRVRARADRRAHPRRPGLRPCARAQRRASVQDDAGQAAPRPGRHGPARHQGRRAVHRVGHHPADALPARGPQGATPARWPQPAGPARHSSLPPAPAAGGASRGRDAVTGLHKLPCQPGVAHHCRGLLVITAAVF